MLYFYCFQDWKNDSLSIIVVLSTGVWHAVVPRCIKYHSVSHISKTWYGGIIFTLIIISILEAAIIILLNFILERTKIFTYTPLYINFNLKIYSLNEKSCFNQLHAILFDSCAQQRHRN